VLARSTTCEDAPVRLRLVHGFSLTSRSWEPVERLLPPDWDAQAIEVPDGLDFVTTAEALGHRGRAGTWVGYSMGARLCLQLALDRPALVESLVLMSGTAGIAGARERRTRRDADERLANDVQRDGVGPFLERWLDQRLFETLPRDLSQLEIRTRGNTVARLQHQLRDLGQGAQEPLWGRLGSLEMPVLVMTGQWDRTYGDLGARMAAAIGDNATIAVISKAGHALHLERPEAVAHELTTWLERSGAA
jgi:2-succinyl-6-hydroxy-2,4-cyclohexadiene-1-carboxylate synthase